MRLRTKFALVLVFVALVMGGGVFVGFDHLRDQSVARAQASVDETAGTTAAQVDDLVRQRRDRVARAAALPAAERFDHTEPFLERFLRNSRFRTAKVVAANGTVIDYRGDISEATREETVGSDVADRAYVRRALAGNVSVSPVTCTQRCTFTVAAPIYTDTRVGGVLTATIPLDRAGVFAPLRLVASADRTVRVTTTVDGERLMLRAPTRSFDRPITGVATVETTGWRVVVAQSRAELSRHLRSMLYIEAVSLLLVLGAVVTLGGWEYRTNLAQTERLLDGFRALQDGDYGYDLSLAGAEEWRQVSDGFNELADGIREREERLQILNRVLRHNLRNDLTVVIGNARKVKQTTADPEVEHAADRILEASDSLNDQGDLAREIEAAMASPSTEREAVDVAQTLRETLQDLGDAYPDVAVETDLPESMLLDAPVGTDVALEQVCENAFEHNTGEEPWVRVDASRTVRDGDHYVSVTVTDNGPGIPTQDREPLQAGEETPVEHTSGLGLWFVRWLVERTDGALEFADRDPHGTRVTVELPAE